MTGNEAEISDMYFIESESYDPYWNLALEEYVFSGIGQKNDCFMLWQNDNTIVVGRYQNTAEEINTDYVESHNIRVVRRMSGGGAVYHDKGNLNFTLITDAQDENLNFSRLSLPVIAALSRWGVHAEFSGRNDITIDGMKISGNARYIRSRRVLYHGCIMLNTDLSEVAQALRVDGKKIESKGIKSVRSRVTTINDHAPTPISLTELKMAICDEVEKEESLAPYFLSPEDKTAVSRLTKEKYATWEWNYGISPDYTARAEERFPAGKVRLYASVAEGILREVHIRGDFFAEKNIELLERHMVGLRLDQTLARSVEQLQVESYIRGMTGTEMLSLLKQV